MRYARTSAALATMLTAMSLQATLIAPLAAPIPVSLTAVVVAAIALVDGPAVGMSFGFVAGLIADLGSSHPAGVLALTWTLLGLVCGMAATGRSARDDALTAALACAVAAAAADVLLVVVHADGVTAWHALRDVLPAGLGDALLAAAVVPLTRAFLRTEVLRAPKPVLTELSVSRRG